jgi:hypothetical protein
MRFPKTASLILCLAASICSAQVQSEATTKYILGGVAGVQNVGGLLLVPADSKPVLRAVGFLDVDSKGLVTVKASNAKREPVEVKKVDETHFLILGKGKIWIDLTAIDFAAQTFEQEQFTVVIGDDPEPEPDEPDEPDPDEPEPTPDVPGDQFDNLGQRIDKAADAANLQIDLRQRAAEVYSTVAARLQSFELKRASDAAKEIEAGIAALRLGPEWQPVFKIAEDDAAGRGPLTWAVMTAWYAAVAAGMGG